MLLGDLDPILRPFINAILLGLIGATLAFIVSQLLGRLLMRPMGATWGRFVANLVGLVILIFVVKLILDSTGAAGLVVLLAAAITGAFTIGSERAAADIVAGVSLFIARPYMEGDFATLAGKAGKVSKISLISSTLTNVEGDEVFIRNSDITNSAIINHSRVKGNLITVIIPLPAGQDLEKATHAVIAALQNFSPELEGKEFKHSVVFESAAYGYAYMNVRAYVTERLDYGPEKTRLFLTAVDALKAAEIKFSN